VNAPVRVAVGAGLGALLGAWLATTHGAAFASPGVLDPRRWNVIIPGMDMNVVQHAGRGTKVVGGALVLTPHVFSRADIVTPRDTRAVGKVEIALASDSGPVFLRLRDPTHMWAARIAPGVIEADTTTKSFGETLTIEVVGGRVRVLGADVGALTAPTLELSAESSPVRIAHIRVADPAGAVIAEEDAAQAWRESAPVLPGTVLGLLAGGAAAFAGVGGLLALAVPAVILLASPETWLAWVERLYLVRWAPTDLARAALTLSFVPLIVAFLARTGVAMPGLSRARAGLPWLVVCLGCAAVGARAGGIDLLLAPLGLAFLLAPLLLGRQGIDPVGLLVRDLPAQFAVAVLGWGGGLLPALIWRLMLLVSGAGVLLRRAPRLAADAIFLLGIAIFPAAELAVRSTWLDTAWDASRLGATGPVTPFWEDTCGEGPKTILFLGGSSTGGAYQLLGEPGAFFPARTHAALCAARSIRTINLGGSGRDTWTFSRQLELLSGYRPSVVVGYFGVNDLLTQDNPLTRAQREAVEADRSGAERGIAALSERSRLLTGVTLLLRPAVDLAAPVVPDVPLPDAEENLRRIIAAVRAVGGAVLLVPEHAEPETARKIAAYGAMEARLAQELEGVTFVDPGVVLAGAPNALVDRNHLSRSGAAELAAQLVPAIEGLLDGREQ
jgi:hypothetical protein